jgi:hypothetical protein
LNVAVLPLSKTCGTFEVRITILFLIPANCSVFKNNGE